MSDIKEDFLPIYNQLNEWVVKDYNSNTARYLTKEHATIIFNFLNENSSYRKQDGTTSLISKYLEASLGKGYVRVGEAVSSFFSMVYGIKVR